tara:strand:- start:786 stop:1382 length:597 start_codon:yes stop_codon:yes gene_type:complete
MTLNSVKVVILGDSAVGKTSMIQKYVSNNSQTLSTTLGAIYVQLEHNFLKDDKEITFPIQFWDTAGQERYNSLIPMYVRNSDIIIMAFDLSNKETFNSLDKWLKLTKNAGNFKYILVGCKEDLSSSNGPTDSEINIYLEEKMPDTTFIKTSSKKNYNIKELFDNVKQNLEEKIFYKNNFIINKRILLEDNKDNNNCCF